MLAAEHYLEFFADVALPKNELLAIHRSRLPLHRAKAGYNYPTIRLPHIFSKLAALPMRIYQTVHEGALAFLVVVSPGAGSIDSPELLDVEINAKVPVLT
jgi:hypothetical protein